MSREHGGHFHAVRFYRDDDSLCRIVGEFVGAGLEAGERAIVIATADHTRRIEGCLRERGLDINNLKELGDFVTLDAREILATFMRNDEPDRARFNRHVGDTLRQLARGRENTPVRAYGEMVDLLWKDGLEQGAIRLETLWNELANTHEFKLLCGYSMGNFYKGAALEQIHAEHSHLVDEGGGYSAIH
jgi:hypothetical protein